jgi:hypothetical protein
MKRRSCLRCWYGFECISFCESGDERARSAGVGYLEVVATDREMQITVPAQHEDALADPADCALHHHRQPYFIKGKSEQVCRLH